MRCLYCYNELEDGLVDFHPGCSKKIFGTAVAPLLTYDEKQMLELGKQVIKSHVAVTGVQPKLSLDIEKTGRHTGKMEPQRFTIVGLWGGYILKPPTPTYPQLPQLEDVTMHLAALSGIATVPHSLIRMQSGNLAYITKRIDRAKGEKIHMEDMCQLTERLTENKYKGSYEQIAKAIIKYSINPGLDMINFFEQVVFSFLTGNADMHLKNFSLIKRPGIGYMLSPAYDMIPSSLVMEGDYEELALNLYGKKRNMQKKDFDAFVIAVKLLEERSVENIYNKFRATMPRWFDLIPVSFIDRGLQDQYISLIKERAAVLGLM
jgi:serine/threonine-protein kinase HipA